MNAQNTTTENNRGESTTENSVGTGNLLLSSLSLQSPSSPGTPISTSANNIHQQQHQYENKHSTNGGGYNRIGFPLQNQQQKPGNAGVTTSNDDTQNTNNSSNDNNNYHNNNQQQLGAAALFHNNNGNNLHHYQHMVMMNNNNHNNNHNEILMNSLSQQQQQQQHSQQQPLSAQSRRLEQALSGISSPEYASQVLTEAILAQREGQRRLTSLVAASTSNRAAGAGGRVVLSGSQRRSQRRTSSNDYSTVTNNNMNSNASNNNNNRSPPYTSHKSNDNNNVSNNNNYNHNGSSLHVAVTAPGASSRIIPQGYNNMNRSSMGLTSGASQRQESTGVSLLLNGGNNNNDNKNNSSHHHDNSHFLSKLQVSHTAAAAPFGQQQQRPPASDSLLLASPVTPHAQHTNAFADQNHSSENNTTTTNNNNNNNQNNVGSGAGNNGGDQPLVSHAVAGDSVAGNMVAGAELEENQPPGASANHHQMDIASMQDLRKQIEQKKKKSKLRLNDVSAFFGALIPTEEDYLGGANEYQDSEASSNPEEEEENEEEDDDDSKEDNINHNLKKMKKKNKNDDDDEHQDVTFYEAELDSSPVGSTGFKLSKKPNEVASTAAPASKQTGEEENNNIDTSYPSVSNPTNDPHYIAPPSTMTNDKDKDEEQQQTSLILTAGRNNNKNKNDNDNNKDENNNKEEDIDDDEQQPPPPQAAPAPVSELLKLLREDFIIPSFTFSPDTDLDDIAVERTTADDAWDLLETEILYNPKVPMMMSSITSHQVSYTGGGLSATNIQSSAYGNSQSHAGTTGAGGDENKVVVISGGSGGVDANEESTFGHPTSSANKLNRQNTAVPADLQEENAEKNNSNVEIVTRHQQQQQQSTKNISDNKLKKNSSNNPFTMSNTSSPDGNTSAKNYNASNGSVNSADLLLLNINPKINEITLETLKQDKPQVQNLVGVSRRNTKMFQVARLTGLTGAQIRRFTLKAKTLMQVDSENVQFCYGVNYDASRRTLDIFLEYLGDHNTVSNFTSSIHHNEFQIGTYAIQLLGGLRALHEKGLWHLNVKPSTVFLESSGTVKLGGLFCSSKLVVFTDDGENENKEQQNDDDDDVEAGSNNKLERVGSRAEEVHQANSMIQRHAEEDRQHDAFETWGAIGDLFSIGLIAMEWLRYRNAPANPLFPNYFSDSFSVPDMLVALNPDDFISIYTALGIEEELYTSELAGQILAILLKYSPDELTASYEEIEELFSMPLPPGVEPPKQHSTVATVDGTAGSNDDDPASRGGGVDGGTPSRSNILSPDASAQSVTNLYDKHNKPKKEVPTSSSAATTAATAGGVGGQTTSTSISSSLQKRTLPTLTLKGFDGIEEPVVCEVTDTDRQLLFANENTIKNDAASMVALVRRNTTLLGTMNNQYGGSMGGVDPAAMIHKSIAGLSNAVGNTIGEHFGGAQGLRQTLQNLRATFGGGGGGIDMMSLGGAGTATGGALPSTSSNMNNNNHHQRNHHHHQHGGGVPLIPVTGSAGLVVVPATDEDSPSNNQFFRVDNPVSAMGYGNDTETVSVSSPTTSAVNAGEAASGYGSRYGRQNSSNIAYNDNNNNDNSPQRRHSSAAAAAVASSPKGDINSVNNDRNNSTSSSLQQQQSGISLPSSVSHVVNNQNNLNNQQLQQQRLAVPSSKPHHHPHQNQQQHDFLSIDPFSDDFAGNAMNQAAAAGGLVKIVATTPPDGGGGPDSNAANNYSNYHTVDTSSRAMVMINNNNNHNNRNNTGDYNNSNTSHHHHHNNPHPHHNHQQQQQQQLARAPSNVRNMGLRRGNFFNYSIDGSLPHLPGGGNKFGSIFVSTSYAPGGRGATINNNLRNSMQFQTGGGISGGQSQQYGRSLGTTGLNGFMVTGNYGSTNYPTANYPISGSSQQQQQQQQQQQPQQFYANEALDMMSFQLGPLTSGHLRIGNLGFFLARNNVSILHAVDEFSNRQFIVKRVNVTEKHQAKSVLKRVKNEALLLTRANHPNVVKCYAHFFREQDKMFILLMESIPGKTLETIRKTVDLSEAQVASFTRELVSILKFLHYDCLSTAHQQQQQNSAASTIQQNKASRILKPGADDENNEIHNSPPYRQQRSKSITTLSALGNINNNQNRLKRIGEADKEDYDEDHDPLQDNNNNNNDDKKQPPDSSYATTGSSEYNTATTTTKKQTNNNNNNQQHRSLAGIAHFDIKPQNVILQPDGEIKLIDFGEARKLVRGDILREIDKMTPTGTSLFMPPEQFDLKFSFKADVWAVGCFVVYMLIGKPCFLQENQSAYGLANLISSLEPDQPIELPPELQELFDRNLLSKSCEEFIRYCLTVDHDKRPTTKDLCEHPWLCPDNATCFPGNSDLDFIAAAASGGGTYHSSVGAGGANDSHTLNQSPDLHNNHLLLRQMNGESADNSAQQTLNNQNNLMFKGNPTSLTMMSQNNNNNTNFGNDESSLGTSLKSSPYNQQVNNNIRQQMMNVKGSLTNDRTAAFHQDQTTPTTANNNNNNNNHTNNTNSNTRTNGPQRNGGRVRGPRSSNANDNDDDDDEYSSNSGGELQQQHPPAKKKKNDDQRQRQRQEEERQLMNDIVLGGASGEQHPHPLNNNTDNNRAPNDQNSKNNSNTNSNYYNSSNPTGFSSMNPSLTTTTPQQQQLQQQQMMMQQQQPRYQNQFQRHQRGFFQRSLRSGPGGGGAGTTLFFPTTNTNNNATNQQQQLQQYNNNHLTAAAPTSAAPHHHQQQFVNANTASLQGDNKFNASIQFGGISRTQMNNNIANNHSFGVVGGPATSDLSVSAPLPADSSTNNPNVSDLQQQQQQQNKNLSGNNNNNQMLPHRHSSSPVSLLQNVGGGTIAQQDFSQSNPGGGGGVDISGVDDTSNNIIPYPGLGGGVGGIGGESSFSRQNTNNMINGTAAKHASSAVSVLTSTNNQATLKNALFTASFANNNNNSHVSLDDGDATHNNSNNNNQQATHNQSSTTNAENNNNSAMFPAATNSLNSNTSAGSSENANNNNTNNHSNSFMTPATGNNNSMNASNNNNNAIASSSVSSARQQSTSATKYELHHHIPNSADGAGGGGEEAGTLSPRPKEKTTFCGCL